MASRPESAHALLAWFSGTWLVLRRPVHALAIGLAGAMAGPVLGLVVMGGCGSGYRPVRAGRSWRACSLRRPPRWRWGGAGRSASPA